MGNESGAGAGGGPQSLSDYLRDRQPKGFKPVPHYNPFDDSVTVFFEDIFGVAEQLSPNLTIYRDRETRRIVGVKIAGVARLIKDDKAARSIVEVVSLEAPLPGE